MEPKVCSECGTEKPLTDFYFQNSKPIAACKECTRKRSRRFYANNSEKVEVTNARWKEKNPDKVRGYKAGYKKRNREAVLAAGRKYVAEHKQKHSERGRLWCLQNPERKRETRRQWRAKKGPKQFFARLVDNLRKRIQHALKGNSKSEATMHLLGCSVEQLRAHLEKQFAPGMSWDTYGVFGWHVDHIKPCSSFDLTDPEQQKICFHYTNLQPLWAIDNMLKGAKSA